MKKSNLSFLDIDKLPSSVSESIKDEIRIANLHGYDLTRIAKRFLSDPERIYCIRRLVISGSVELEDKLLTSYDTDILRILVKYTELHMDFRVILSRYTTKDHRLLVEKDTLTKLMLGYLSNPDIFKYDFLDIKPDLVSTFIYAVKSKVDVLDLQKYSLTHPSDVVKLLVNLKVAGIPIQGFLTGDWKTSQIYALISGSSIVAPEILIEQYDVDETFPEGSIKEIIRAYEINPELAMLVASKDEEGIPIYNQYQMYEVTEGIRLHLDVSSYYQPSYTDLQMRLKREELIKIEERRTGKKFKERILSKSNIKLDDDQLNTIIQDIDDN